MLKTVDEFLNVDEAAVLKVGTDWQPPTQSLSATQRSEEPGRGNGQFGKRGFRIRGDSLPVSRMTL